jgi:hypothetical protein
MPCRHCAAPLPSNSEVCFHCGNSQTEAAGAPRAEAPVRPLAAIVLLLVVVAAGAGGFLVMRQAGSRPEVQEREALAEDGVEKISPMAEPPPPPAAPWDGTSPLRCSGDESHVLKGATVAVGASGIRAEGRCRVTLQNCRLEAPLRIEGDAEVVVKGGSIAGEVRALERGRLTLERVAVEGSLRLDDDARLSMTAGRIDAVQAFDGALRAGGTASASLSAVTVVGTIDARDDSLVKLEGGVIGVAEPEDPVFPRGTDAIRVDNGAAVTLRDTSIERGRISRHGAGVVIELAEGDDAPARIATARERAEKISRYQRSGCAGFVACFLDNRSFGAVDVSVSMPIAPDGRAKLSRISRAQGANAAARACLQKVASERAIEGFDGPPGKLECSFSGTITEGARMLSMSQAFRPDEP